MRKILLIITAVFSLAACDLSKLEPAQTKAFIKYFGEDGNTVGADLLKLDDGYLLLGNNNETNALLIKTDLKGNTLWGQVFANFTGRALAKMNEGYFIIGDSIDNVNPPRMRLIKTDLEGNKQTSTTLGEVNVAYHGTALTISSLEEVVVCGYTVNSTTNTQQTFIFGYNNSDLSNAWSAVRRYGGAGVTRISSKTINENEDGEFVWSSLNNNTTIESLRAAKESSVSGGFSILSDYTISGEFGDFTYTSIGNVAVQTVVGTNNNAIAISNYDSNRPLSNALIETDGDLSAQVVVRASDGDFVVLGTTKNTSGTRSDLDFYLTKVGIDGKEGSLTGFTNIIGGTGNETGAAIVQAEDKGFVFLGTMQNLMMLVKVNSKGELIN